MSHYKPYPTYRPSGVEWIGDVPSDWEIARIKHTSSLRTDRCTDAPEGSQYIGLEDVESGTGQYRPTAGSARQNEDSTVGVFKSGDVLYGKLRPYLKKAIVSNTNGVCSTEFLVLQPKTVLAPWLHQWLLTTGVTQQIEAGCEGTKMPRADWEHVGSIHVPSPDTSQQAEIFAVLDRETKRIDSLITKKTRFIELLKEKRQALITHAVTKGLDPNVKMRDSGVEWIGEVPHHWTLLRLANVGQLRKAGGGNKQDDADSGVACIRYGDLYTTYDVVIRDIKKYISSDSAADYTNIEYGDVLFAASGETFEDIGKSSANLTTQEARCGGDVIVLRLYETADPVYVAYAVSSTSAQAQKAQMGKGFTVIHIYGDQLRNLVIAAPYLNEQRKIGQYLEQRTKLFDGLIAKTRHSIDLLKERRSAFITAAVTGQIDLRESV